MRAGQRLLLLIGVVFVALLPALARADKRVAIVIGNSSYVYASWLANPENDARDVADTLRELGFELIFRANADKASLDSALAEFERKAQKVDVSLFFYAGHGLQFRGRNYLLPVDAKLEDDVSLRYETLAVDKVREALEAAGGVRLLILDACRDSPLKDRLMTRTASGTRGADFSRGLARLDRADGMVVAYATQADQVAQDGSGRNSPFSAALISALKEPNLEIATLFRRVAQRVYEQTGGRQRPELSISLLQDFYLNIRDDDSRVTEADLQSFIARFPTSPYVRDAQNRLGLLEAIRREREEIAAKIATIDSERRDIQRREDERLVAERREQDRRDRERSEQEQLAMQRRERERQDIEARLRDLRAQEQREQERLATARAETDRLARQKADFERLIAKRLDEERVAARDREQQSAALEAERRDAASQDGKRARDEAARARAEAQDLRRREQDRQRLAAIEQENLRKAEDATRKQKQAEVCSQESSEIHRLAGLRRKDELITMKTTLACPGLQPSINTAVAQIAKAQTVACAEEGRALQRIGVDNLQALQVFAGSATCNTVLEKAKAQATRLQASFAQRDAACALDEQRLSAIVAGQSDKAQAVADLRSLQTTLECERLRVKVGEALKAAEIAIVKRSNTTDQIKTAQIELRRIGCYGGQVTGAMSAITRRALDGYARERQLGADMAVDAELLLSLRAEPGLVCRTADATATGADLAPPRARPPSGGPACATLIEKGQLMELNAEERDFLRSRC